MTVADITKTIVVTAGANTPWTLDGVNLADVVANPSSYAGRAVLHAVLEYGSPFGEGLTTTTLRDGSVVPCKLFRYASRTGSDRYESYYLDTDPHELANLGSGIAGFDELEASLNALSAGTVPIVDEHGGGRDRWSPSTRRRLTARR